MNGKEILSYLKEYAPDVNVLSFGESLVRTVDNYYLDLFGEENKEVVGDSITIILQWLVLPEISDEIEDDFLRIYREDNFSKDAAYILKNHKAHPTALQSLILSLQLLSDYESRFVEQEFTEELACMTRRYKALRSIRKELRNTHALIWQTLDDVFTEEEQDELKKGSYAIVNTEIVRLITRIKEIAREVLRLLEK